MSFYTDLSDAKHSEIQFANILISGGYSNVSVSNLPTFYDVTATSGSNSFRYEIKNDKLASVTGNVAIEISRDGNPTGIYETQADFWCHRVDDHFYCYNVGRLRQMIPHYRTVLGGDGRRTRMALIPFEVFRKKADFTL